MNNVIDFENEFKNYERIYPSAQNFKNNIGKQIIWVDRIDPYRGYFSIKTAIIHGMHYKRLLIDDGYDSIDIRDIKDCGVKND